MTHRYFIPLFFLIFVLPGFTCFTYGQRDTTKMNQQVEVVKAYRPSISNAEKINLLPEIDDTTKFRPDLNYSTMSHPINSGFIPSALKASNQFQREISYPGYGKISGGFGTSLTPFFDLFLSNPNSQNGTFGVQFNHLSSMGKVKLKGGSEMDAPFSNNHGIIFGSYVLNDITISSELNYQRDMNRFYGYPVIVPVNTKSDNFLKYFNTDQLNQLGFFDLTVKSNASSLYLLKFNTGINLSYFNTSTNQVEKVIRLKGDFAYDFGTFSGKLKIGFDHFETENVTNQPDFAPLSSPKNTWIKLSPTFYYQNDLLSIEGGLNLYTVFDNLNGASSTRFIPYPKAEFSYHTEANNFNVYLDVDGYLENNNYSKIAEENRWINPGLRVKPTNHRYILSGGVKGKIATPLTFNLGLKYSKTEEQYFFITRVEDRTALKQTDLAYNPAFEVEYDDLGTFDFTGNLSYTTSNIFLLLSGHFYNYQLNSLVKAPYLPDFILNANSSFKLTNKISAMAELYFTGPRNVMLKFYLPPLSSAIGGPAVYLKTDAMIEANVGAKYRFIKNLEFLGRIENLFNRKDEPWYGYTIQGIRFKLGASLSF